MNNQVVIDRLEFVEIYEDIAITAAQALRDVVSNRSLSQNLNWSDMAIASGQGGRFRLTVDETPEWWNRIEIIEDEGKDQALRFVGIDADVQESWDGASGSELLDLRDYIPGDAPKMIAWKASARRDRLEALVDEGYSRARTVIRASERLSIMLAGAQLGITICSIVLGRVGEPAIAHLLEKPLEWASVPHALLHPISFTVSLGLVVIAHILLGEMVPKNIALAGPERSAMLLVPVHLLFVRLTRPVIAVYNWLANISLRALRVTPRDERCTSRTPRRASVAAMALVAVGWVIFRSAAALLKLPVSTMRTKVLMARSLSMAAY